MNRSGDYLNYDEFAGIYDRTRIIPDGIIDTIVAACANHARVGRDGRFLDAGVGTGRFGVSMARSLPGRVWGVDISTDMLAAARSKSEDIRLVRGDLLRLPFSDGAFRGALIVHILHLIREWRTVVGELRRVIAPDGVLFLGAELGGRSILVDYYLQQARARGISTDNLGAPGVTQPLAYLRQRTSDGVIPRVDMVSDTSWSWRRRASVSETISSLQDRAYSQMRFIDDAAHAQLIDATRSYAIAKLGSLEFVEDLEARFVLYAVRYVRR